MSNKSHELGNEKSPVDTEFSVDFSERQSVEVRDRFYHRIVDSFKRAEHEDEAVQKDLENAEVESATVTRDHLPKTKLKTTIQPRHTVMMSLGTGIGTGLLVANGKSLYYGGPGGLVIGYALVSIISYLMMQALGELTLAYPTLPGNFSAFQAMFISPAWGFATVYIGLIQWATVLPLEMITASMTIQYWTTSVSPDVWVVIIYVFLLCIHYYGSGRCYAEFEFFFNTCKILMVIGFVILGIIINAGGAGNSGYIGAKYWHDPGSFADGGAGTQFKGVCYVLINGFFSYGGQELYALTVNESSNPRKAIPSATKKSIYRILIIYMLTMILVGFLVPRNSDELMGSGGSATHASPYVIAIASHGVKVVPSFINAVILISVISVANTALYSAPRMLCSLATQGMAPKFLDYVDRRGRPLLSLSICSIFGVIAFCAASSNEEDVFTWLVAISGLAELFTWTGICLSHVRFRRALKVQGETTDDLGYKAITGVWGSIYAVFFNILVFIAQFWVALSPIGQGVSALAFFESYLAAPIWIVLYVGYMIYTKDFTLLVPLKSINLNSHRRRFDPEVLKLEDIENKRRLKEAGWVARVAAFWC